jgi:hypothetical protein
VRLFNIQGKRISDNSMNNKKGRALNLLSPGSRIAAGRRFTGFYLFIAVPQLPPQQSAQHPAASAVQHPPSAVEQQSVQHVPATALQQAVALSPQQVSHFPPAVAAVAVSLPIEATAAASFTGSAVAAEPVLTLPSLFVQQAQGHVSPSALHFIPSAFAPFMAQAFFAAEAVSTVTPCCSSSPMYFPGSALILSMQLSQQT